MGTTTKVGIPWPEGTDFLMDGDNAMRAIAERLDGAALQAVPYGLAAGFALVDMPAGGAASAEATVTWPVGRFSAAPIVTTVCTAGTINYLANARASTTTGCIIICFHKSGQSTSTQDLRCDWHAIQMTSTSGPGLVDLPYMVDVTCATMGCPQEGVLIGVPYGPPLDEPERTGPDMAVCGVCFQRAENFTTREA